MNSSKIIVTGTNDLSGWKILSYLGIVSSHVVTGTGLFSDISAGFTDLFGGRSGTYQKQIQNIEYEAISIITEKAKKLGATAILGAKIDHDEISGKNMQMFMVTVYGTAVIAIKDKEEINNEVQFIIDKESLENEILKLEIIKKTASVPFSLTSEEWAYVYSNELVKLNENVILNIKYYSDENLYLADKENIIKYYRYVRNKEITYSLYKCIQDNPSCFDVIYEIIQECKLCDFTLIMDLLQSNNELVNQCGLLLLGTECLDYYKEDYKIINNILEFIESKYKEKIEYIEEKIVMSSKMKKKWVCTCGQKNDESSDRCSSCSCDKYGFKYNEPHINEIQEGLRIKSEALKSLLQI